MFARLTRTLTLLVGVLMLGVPTFAVAQTALPPIIDMHLHAYSADANGPPPLALCLPLVSSVPTHDLDEPWADAFMRFAKNPPCPDPVWSADTDDALMRETITAMERRNVIGVLSGRPDRVRRWHAAAGSRVVPSVEFQLGRDNTSPDQMRELLSTGGFQVIGEISNQYVGISPDDDRMEPYWSVAEELDVPVAIHLGSGPPGAPYLGYPRMRVSLGSALLLEDVLIRHPRLRVSLMHYGHQRLDDTIALLEHHPQVYLDLGGIQWYYPRAFFYRQLQQLVDAGFAKRIMFGSDQMNWPDLIDVSIEVIEDAPFLSDDQKRDIFYNNAARFLRLSAADIARHHGN